MSILLKFKKNILKISLILMLANKNIFSKSCKYLSLSQTQKALINI